MVLNGVYQSTVFRNEANGFTVFNIRLVKPIDESSVLLYRCSGTIPSVYPGMPISVTGEFVENKYGTVFQFTKLEPNTDSEKDVVEYLSSKYFKGISKAMAKEVVRRLGSDVFQFAKQPDSIERLSKVPGFNLDIATNTIRVINHTEVQYQIAKEILDYGGTFTQALQIYCNHADQALDLMHTTPYQLYQENLIPFKIADLIAKDQHIAYDHPARIRALILETMRQGLNRGHAYVPIESVYRVVASLIRHHSAFPGNDIPIGVIGMMLDSMQEFHCEIIQDEVRYYLNRSYYDECSIADHIRRLQTSGEQHPIDVDRTVAEIESSLNITYSPQQKQCFRFLCSNGLKVITGGPGTGKSTVVNGLITAFRKLFPYARFQLMAPTGRAAQRLSEITGFPAGTIHRTLNVLPYHNLSAESSYFENFPADFIVIDEVSMLDNELCSVLLKAVKNNCMVIFCGDIDQLPSVGAGAVLHEMMETNVIPTVRLSVNYRQKGKGTIIDNATKINTGIKELTSDASFRVAEFKNEFEMESFVLSTFSKLYCKDDPYAVQILSSTRIGRCGTLDLNRSIQRIQHTRTDPTKSEDTAFSANSKTLFYLGDKVMTVRNCYKDGYLNGDVGTIIRFDEDAIVFKTISNTITIPKSNIEDLELAYACTVHKSQGTEYNTVIVVLPPHPTSLLKRNLLYTAITRAKTNVIVVTCNNSMETAIEQNDADHRYSGLSEKINNRMRCFHHV